MLRRSQAGSCAWMVAGSVPGRRVKNTQPDWQPQQVRKVGWSENQAVKSMRATIVKRIALLRGRSRTTPEGW